MKRALIILLGIVYLVSCRRDIDPVVVDHEFTEVKSSPQFTTCDISCRNVGVQQSERVYARVLLSVGGDMEEVESYPMEETDTCLMCHITGLSEGTRYYYTFEAYTSAETYRSKDIYDFTTSQSSGLTVTTGEVYDVMQTSAKAMCMVMAALGKTSQATASTTLG